MMRTSVLMVSLVLHLVTCDPYLLDDCIVKETGRVVHLSTFEDAVEFRIERFIESDVFVVVSQGSTEARFRLGDLGLNTWREVRLTLAEEPKLRYGNKTLEAGAGERIVKGTRKNIEVQNAHVVWQCKEGWPNRELGKDDDENKVMALSERDEESLILKPLADTKITFSVDSKDMTLCTGQDKHLKVFDAGQESECTGDLENNTRYRVQLRFNDMKKTAQVLDGDDVELASFQYTKKNLRFLRTNLEGTFYIVQCLNPCNSADDSSGSERISVLPVTIVTAALVTIFQSIWPSLPFIAGSWHFRCPSPGC